jgi:hypothetical protein
MNNKSRMIALASATLAVSSSAFLATDAEAGRRGGGFRFHFGHHRTWTPTFEKNHEYEPKVIYRRVIEKRVIQKKPAAVAATAAAAKHADDKGREFDQASKVWFDGSGKCWSGKESFSYKSGVWFYGSARWYEAKGEWKTNAAEQPMPIDCEASPKFAGAMKPAAEKKSAGGEGDKGTKVTEQATAKTQPVPAATVKTAVQKVSDKAADAPKAAECKKYFPSVGEVLTVPCE